MIETKKRSLILYIVLDAIILLIAVLFWPNNNKVEQSNDIDPSKAQIKIKVKRINIREEASVMSNDIGDVYSGEIYTVLSHVDTEKYYWYHIKTNHGVEGYIASNPKDEYVEVISGYIDRTPPVIQKGVDMLLFYNGVENYDSIKCYDNYSECNLSFEKITPEVLEIKAVDEDLNETKTEIKYYNIYDLPSEYKEENENFNVYLSTNKKNNINYFNISFTLNKDISYYDASSSYSPIVDFFDQDFNIIENNTLNFNQGIFSNTCINNYKMILKNGYSNLTRGKSLCMNFSFENIDDSIKYIAFGFSSDENFVNKDNALADYYSKYFILN